MHRRPVIQRTILSIYVAAFALLPALAHARDVRVRTGQHDEYSRLVFDWTQNVGYTLERAQGTLTIAFDQAAQLDSTALQANPVPNISGLSVLSADPLKISVKIPEESRVRDLRAGTKVVVDVYNPPGGAPVQKPSAVSENKSAPSKQTQQAKEQPTPSPQETPQDEEQAAPETASAQGPQGEPQEEPKKVHLQMHEEPSLITVSSTENFGMAAFTLAGRLWIVNDKSDLLVEPQLSGPKAGEFRPFKEMRGETGVAYVTNAPKEKLTGQGGGVLWRLQVGDEHKASEDPATPVRADVNRDDVRSGKLMWPLKGAKSVLKFNDPLTGRSVVAVTVDSADEFAGPPREFVDFEVLSSPVGLAIAPKVSDLQVQIVRGGVEISKPGGLTMVDEGLIDSMTAPKRVDEQGQEMAQRPTGPRIFDFKGWQLGGLATTGENKRIILSGLNNQSETARAEDILTLAKMYVANAMGPEALGALDYALMGRPGLVDGPEFTALYGVASALSHHNEEAFSALSKPVLEPFDEINFWRAYVLADEGDWQQAAAIMPPQLDILYDYPVLLQNRLIPVLAEILLRAGDLKHADVLLAIAEKNKESMLPPQQAALEYLIGESYRQRGEIDETVKKWEPLTTGPDDLYRAKAGLALTRLEVDNDKMNEKEAIDNLERLRYAWRGDELEVQIYYWLGKTYFDNGEYLKGLSLMRDAVSYDTGTALGQRVAAEMADLFSELFLSNDIDQVNPLDAVSIYDEFKELVPLDERGNQIIERLAESLAKADLLGRAGDLLKYQLDHRLEGADIYRIGLRVAAIRLLDNQPDKAIEALNIAAAQLEKLPDEMKTKKRYQAITMLRARALSRKGRPDQALALLNDLDRDADMNRLRADIAWTAGYWDDAAEALGDVIIDQKISMTRPLDDENTALLLQRAIALNLAGDRIALANMREKYSDLMAQTTKAKVFEVITRPRQSGALADRETLLSVVSEVDLFKEFLDSYKNAQPPVN